MPKPKRKEEEIMRTMIYLDAETHSHLRHIAVDERVSMSELIRRAVDEFLKQYRAKKKGGGKG
jgi:metal-responsive CopG/Arc/MetJ family transcriptional regulator